MEFIFQQSIPCSMTKLISYISHLMGKTNLELFKDIEHSSHNVTILDARKVSPGNFHETGFTMVTLDKEPVTTDWRATFQFTDKPDIMHFHKQMEPYIMELYPDTKKIWWTINVVRGGDKFGDQPRAVGGPHLDYYQDDQARLEFHKEFPEMDGEPGRELRMLMGKMNKDDLEMKVLLGVWKPLHPAKVCDYPLALMDARTFKPENLAKNKVHVNIMPGINFHSLGGAISFNEEQKWYYYSNQTPLEVLIFHQYSKGKWFNNPHTSFLNKNCPKDSGERMSVELRVGLMTLWMV